MPQPAPGACIAASAEVNVAHFGAHAEPPQALVPTAQPFAQAPAVQPSPVPHDQVNGSPLQVALHSHEAVPSPVQVTFEAVKHCDAVPDRHVLPLRPLDPEDPRKPPDDVLSG